MVQPSFAVVVPVYNESTGAIACARAVSAVLATIRCRNVLIVVDDGSTDDSPNALQTAQAELVDLLVLTHPHNLGYGAALQTGVREAARRGYDYVLFMDSDLTNDPHDIPRFVEHMARGVDVIKGSRYVPGGGREGVPWRRSAISAVGNIVARRLFRLPLHDCTNGFRAVRTQLLVGQQLRETGFAVIMEELYRLQPLARSYAEVPVVLTTRAEGLRPTVFSYTFSTLVRYLKYPLLSALRSLSSAISRGQAEAPVAD